MTEKTTIEQLINDVKNHQDWRVRQQSIQQLGEYDTAEAMEVIATALYDDSPHVVQTSALTLAQFGSDAVPLLLEALNSERDIASPAFILHALGQIGDPSAIPAVIEILETEDKGLHGAALSVVTKIPDEQFIEPVMELMDQTSEYMKHTIAQALGAIASPRAIDALKPMLYSSEQVTRRYSALALGRIGNEEAANVLLDASRSSVGDVRYNVAEGLGLLHDERAFERLVDLTKDEYPLARAMAAQALARFDGKRAQPHLLKLLDDPDSNVQNFLKSALGNLTDLEIIPVLIKRYRDDYMHSGDGLYGYATKRWDYPQRGENAVHEALNDLKSDNQNLRIAATWLLYAYTYELWYALMDWDKAGKTREEFDETELQSQLINVLVSLLDDENDDVRLPALESLIRVGDKRATENLIKCLYSDDPLVIQLAASNLANAKDKRVVQPLLEALETENEVTRNRIVLALGAIGGDEAFEGLVGLLTHPHYWTRSNAASALGNLGDKRAIPLLIDRLNEEREDAVREWIITGLSYLRDKRATQAIIDVLTNPRTDDSRYIRVLRDRAIHALYTIRDETSLPTLYDEVNNADEWQARMTATSAIGAIGTPRERANRLFELLEHDHETVRTTAAKDLGYLGARTDDLELRDYIVDNLIQRLQDVGRGYHYSPTVAHMAAKSLYYVGTPEANEALRNWELKRDDDSEEDD